jgi:hypothetical protein
MPARVSGGGVQRGGRLADSDPGPAVAPAHDTNACPRTWATVRGPLARGP